MSTRRDDAAPAGAEDAAAPLLLRAGPPAQDPPLDVETVEALIRCEQEGVPSILWAERSADLDSSAAALVTHVAVADPALHAEAAARVGAEQALLADDAEAAVRIVAERRRARRERRAVDGAAGAGPATGSAPRRIWRRLRRGIRGRTGR